MRICSIKVKLTEEDIFSGIQEYVKMDSFSVDSLTLDENIILACTLKKKVNIALKVKIKIDKVIDNILYLSIIDVNVAKIHIFNGIKNFALKNALKDFKEKGIYINKETISIDLNLVTSNIPSVKFKLVSLITNPGTLEAEVEDLQVSKKKEEIEEIEEIIEEGEIMEEKESVEIIKVNDKYTSLRANATKKVPEKYSALAEYAFLVPDIIILFGRLLKDKRVSLKDRLVIGSIVTYFASPIDIGLLFIPVVGEVSVVAMAFYGVSYVMGNIPEQIILDNWQGKQEQIAKVKNGVKIINKMTGGKSILKLLKFSKRKKIRK